MLIHYSFCIVGSLSNIILVLMEKGVDRFGAEFLGGDLLENSQLFISSFFLVGRGSFL